MRMTMIARIWHGVTLESKSDGFFAYIKGTGEKDCRCSPGNCGVYVLRRVEDGKAHFLFVSLWDSYESIKRFAGSDYEKAVYYPEDENFLLELEPTVTHHEVLRGPQNPGCLQG